MADDKEVKKGSSTSEFWAMLGGVLLGGALTVAGALIPGAQALIPIGPGVIATAIAGYQVSRGLAKQ